MDLSRYGPSVNPLAAALAAGGATPAPNMPGISGQTGIGTTPAPNAPGISAQTGMTGTPAPNAPGITAAMGAASPNSAAFPAPYAGLPIGPGGANPGIPIAQPGSNTPSPADIAMSTHGLASPGGAGPGAPVGVGAPVNGPQPPPNTPFGFGLPQSYVGRP
jgi:hypothetical protein